MACAVRRRKAAIRFALLAVVTVLACASACLVAPARSLAGTRNDLAGTPLDELHAVSCPSGNWCLAVGYSQRPTAQVPLAEVWNGATWAIKSTPNHSVGSDNERADVSCSSPSACTAVGQANFNGVSTLIERWNGTKWVMQASPSP